MVKKDATATVAEAPSWGGGALPLNEDYGDPTTPTNEPELPLGDAPVEQGVGLDGRPWPDDTATAPAEPEAPKKRGPGRPRKEKPADDGLGAVNLTNLKGDLVNGVERIERVMEEIGALKEDAKEIFGELKSRGYSTSIIRKVIARRAMDPDKRKEQDALLDLYEEALR